MTIPRTESAMLHELHATRAIERAVQNYIRGQDRLDAPLQRSAFHDDAYVDCGVFAGDPDSYVAFAQAALRRYDASHHLLGQMSIDIEGDRGQGEIYFLAWHRLGQAEAAQDVFIAGRYIDEYADRGTGWKIAKRREIMDWGRKTPAQDGFFQTNTQFHFGMRNGQDFSETRNWPPPVA